MKTLSFVCNRVLFVRGEKRNGHEVEYSLSPSVGFKCVCNCTFINRSNFGGYIGRDKRRSTPRNIFLPTKFFGCWFKQEQIKNY